MAIPMVAVEPEDVDEVAELRQRVEELERWRESVMHAAAMLAAVIVGNTIT